MVVRRVRGHLDRHDLVAPEGTETSFPPAYSRWQSACNIGHRRLLALVAGLTSRLFERLSSVCPFPVGTEEDACSLPFRFRSLSTAGLRPDTPVFYAPAADVSRIPEACECRKLQESPFEQDPFAFH